MYIFNKVWIILEWLLKIQNWSFLYAFFYFCLPTEHFIAIANFLNSHSFSAITYYYYYLLIIHANIVMANIL